MIVYKDYISFTILEDQVNLIHSDTVYGPSTVAEINEQYHYMGNELPTLATAIVAWQEIKDKDLSDEDVQKILVDNKFIS